MNVLIPIETIERSIYLIRGHKVMLDSDLALLYGVEVKVLNRAVKRNPKRFPEDFMFQLENQEVEALRCQIGTLMNGVDDNLKCQIGTSSWGGRRHFPYAFTEHGVAMLSSVLRSDRAIEVNIAIMRAFSKLREMLSSHKDLARKLEALEKKYDTNFRAVFDAIRQLMSPKSPPAKRRIGFL